MKVKDLKRRSLRDLLDLQGKLGKVIKQKKAQAAKARERVIARLHAIRHQGAAQ